MIQGPRAMPAAFFLRLLAEAAFFCDVSSIFDSHKAAKNTKKGIYHFFIKKRPLCDEFLVAAVRPLWKERTGMS
jgi:hypothetical protein